jgi:hypothetical protein
LDTKAAQTSVQDVSYTLSSYVVTLCHIMMGCAGPGDSRAEVVAS